MGKPVFAVEKKFLHTLILWLNYIFMFFVWLFDICFFVCFIFNVVGFHNVNSN